MKAKLVYVSFVTRVCVKDDATEEEILSIAKGNLLKKVQNDLGDNLEEIVDDIECPYEMGYDDEE